MHATTNLPGRKIPQGHYSAFVPAPLPPKFAWTPRLIRVLSDADRLIGKLAGEGGRLPNPHVLMRPYVQREAVLSSKIEGTQATLGELLAAEAGAVVDRDPETQMGPLVSEKQRQRVLGYLERGQQEGARPLLTGGAATVPGHAGGYYVKPALLTGAPDNLCAREEIFGHSSVPIRLSKIGGSSGERGGVS